MIPRFMSPMLSHPSVSFQCVTKGTQGGILPQMSDREYLIHDVPWKALLVFSLPMMLGNLFQQLYTMTDSVIVGRFVGEKALAAVGASYSLTSVFIAVAIGGGVGSSVLVSRAFGSRRYDELKTAVCTSLISFLVLSLLLSAFGYAFSDGIMRLLNTPEDIHADAVFYLRIYFLGLPFLFMYNILSSVFNALGRSRIPLYFLIFSSLLNVALDLLMVAVLGQGIAGAAWATLIAQGISACFSFAVLMRTLSDMESTGSRLFDSGVFGRMVVLAIPSILQQSTVSIGMMLVQSVVNGFGSQVLAGYSAGMRLENIATVPMVSIGNAMSSYTAQNLGARNEERVSIGYRSSYWMVIFFAIVICLAFELFSVPLVGMFIGESGTDLAYGTGVSYLRFMGWFFAIIGFKMATDGVLRGSGDVKVFTAANLANLGTRVAFSFILAPVIGVAAVWYIVPVGWLINWGISFIGYSRGIWRNEG